MWSRPAARVVGACRSVFRSSGTLRIYDTARALTGSTSQQPTKACDKSGPAVKSVERLQSLTSTSDVIKSASLVSLVGDGKRFMQQTVVPERGGEVADTKPRLSQRKILPLKRKMSRLDKLPTIAEESDVDYLNGVVRVTSGLQRELYVSSVDRLVLTPSSTGPWVVQRLSRVLAACTDSKPRSLKSSDTKFNVGEIAVVARRTVAAVRAQRSAVRTEREERNYQKLLWFYRTFPSSTCHVGRVFLEDLTEEREKQLEQLRVWMRPRFNLSGELSLYVHLDILIRKQAKLSDKLCLSRRRAESSRPRPDFRVGSLFLPQTTPCIIPETSSALYSVAPPCLAVVPYDPHGFLQSYDGPCEGVAGEEEMTLLYYKHFTVIQDGWIIVTQFPIYVSKLRCHVFSYDLPTVYYVSIDELTRIAQQVPADGGATVGRATSPDMEAQRGAEGGAEGGAAYGDVLSSSDDDAVYDSDVDDFRPVGLGPRLQSDAGGWDDQEHASCRTSRAIPGQHRHEPHDSDEEIYDSHDEEIDAAGDERVGDEPVGDEPVGDEPVGDEPVGDEPVGDEPVLDEPVGGEPVVLRVVDDQWFCVDSVGDVTGPFSNETMSEALYREDLQMDSYVRSGPDGPFVQIGMLIKALGRYPFLPAVQTHMTSQTRHVTSPARGRARQSDDVTAQPARGRARKRSADECDVFADSLPTKLLIVAM